MPQNDIPEEIRRLADARQAARDAREFAEADRLKALVEADGWRIVDQRTSYRLRRSHPATIAEPGGPTRYGWSGAVPSRLDAGSIGVASVVLIAPEDPDALEALLSGLTGAVSDDVQRIIVANAPGPETETLLARLTAQWARETLAGVDDMPASEVVWLIQAVGAAAALNAGIRRAAAPVVILLDASAEALGDFVTPLATALDDPTVAVVGPWGYVSDDQRHFEPVSVADAGKTDVAAIDVAAMAFRRADYAARGPFDERFVDPVLLDVWWSLVLRDPDENEMTPRRATLVDVPAARPNRDRTEPAPDSPAGQILRRNRYRIIATFGGRRDLAVAPGGR